MAWARKRAEHLLKTAIDGNRMLEPGDRVAVGVSGGADSLCLLYLLTQLNSRRRNWQLHAIHIDPGFGDNSADRVMRACARTGTQCLSRAIDVPSVCSRSRENPCYVCSRERRKALFTAAVELGAKKVALGHHLEDVNETFLMNLICTASAATILPTQSLFKGTLTVIRPLYYLDEQLIRAYLRQVRVRPVPMRCPYSKVSTRILFRRLLRRLGRRIPRASSNLFWGIHNLKHEYLPRRVHRPLRPCLAPREQR